MLESRVRRENGVPALYVNGERQAPVVFFTSAAPAFDAVNRRQIRAAAAHGVHLYSASFALPVGRENSDFSEAFRTLDMMIAEDPQAMILMRFSLSLFGAEAEEWGKTHPDDLMRYAYSHTKPYNNDMVNETSMVGTTPAAVTVASDEWLAAAEEALRSFHRTASAEPAYADHILGYHVGGGETGEWFHYGMRERGLDLSPANARQYRRFLRSRYGTLQALESAWCTAPGTFADFGSVPPPDDLPGNDRMVPAARTLFLEPGDRRFTDYCDYSSELMADRIARLARVCREMTEGKKLVVFFYGYLFELYDARTGHFRLDRLLDDPDIDAFSSPVSYTDRNEGGVGALMAPVDSAVLHGKLWFVENDIRSPVVIRRPDGADWVKSVDSVEDYCSVLTREAGQMMAHGLACWYMDLICAGWQYHPMIWARIRELRELYAGLMKDLRPIAPDVAVVADMRAVSLAAHADAVGANALYRMRLHFSRAGVSFGLYTSEDFEAGLVPSAKVVFYLTPYDISDERAETLRGVLCRQHALFVMLHGPGRTSEKAAESLLGMKLVRADGGMMPLEAQAAAGVLPAGAAWDSEGVYRGLEQAANPAWYAMQDGRVRPLAAYCRGPLAGKLAAAYCEHDGFSAVFAGAFLLTAEAIREICRLGGAQIYSESGDMFCAGNGIVLLHTNAQPGKRMVRLPHPQTLVPFCGSPESELAFRQEPAPEQPATVCETDGRANASYLWLDAAVHTPRSPSGKG